MQVCGVGVGKAHHAGVCGVGVGKAHYAGG